MLKGKPSRHKMEQEKKSHSRRFINQFRFERNYKKIANGNIGMRFKNQKLLECQNFCNKSHNSKL